MFRVRGPFVVRGLNGDELAGISAFFDDCSFMPEPCCYSGLVPIGEAGTLDPWHMLAMVAGEVLRQLRGA